MDKTVWKCEMIKGDIKSMLSHIMPPLNLQSVSPGQAQSPNSWSREIKKVLLGRHPYYGWLNQIFHILCWSFWYFWDLWADQCWIPLGLYCIEPHSRFSIINLNETISLTMRGTGVVWQIRLSSLDWLPLTLFQGS